MIRRRLTALSIWPFQHQHTGLQLNRVQWNFPPNKAKGHSKVVFLQCSNPANHCSKKAKSNCPFSIEGPILYFIFQPGVNSLSHNSKIARNDLFNPVFTVSCKTLGFSFLLNPMLCCTFHTFERETKTSD